MAHEMTFAEAVASLEGALRFGIDPSLEGIRALCEQMGRPQDAVRFVQVTGTNGKTSVTRMTAAILRAHGLRTAAYTSPHLRSYIERIEVDGDSVAEADFARGMSAALEAASAVGGEHTEFELLTAAALWLMRDLGVEWGVLEVGMGGRWDATSVVTPAVAVVTGVGLDHTERLGSTVREIAADKAHIIREGSVAVFGPGTAEVADVFEARVAEVGASVLLVGECGFDAEGGVGFAVTARPSAPGGCTRLDVTGVHAAYGDLEVRAPSYQAPNVAVAVAAAEAALGRALDPSAVRGALSAMRFPGRFEVVREDPPVVLDGAHNPQAAGVLAHAIVEAWPDAGVRPIAVLGVLADKDAAGIVAAIAPVVAGFVVTLPASPRALPGDVLAEHVLVATGTRPEVVENPAAAVTRALEVGGGAGVVVTGSLYLVGGVS